MNRLQPVTAESRPSLTLPHTRVLAPRLDLFSQTNAAARHSEHLRQVIDSLRGYMELYGFRTQLSVLRLHPAPSVG